MLGGATLLTGICDSPTDDTDRILRVQGLVNLGAPRGERAVVAIPIIKLGHEDTW
jgi:hypothetical protein